MVDVVNDTSRIDRNVEAVSNYLKKEFENFTIAYQADRPRTHTFIVNNGKKLFKLMIGWPALADNTVTPASIDLLLAGKVAQEMRLHGESGYYWTPST